MPSQTPRSAPFFDGLHRIQNTSAQNGIGGRKGE
jgi:hypothetical protein